MPSFFRFPNTPHLAWLSDGEPRDDKVLSPAEAHDLLAGDVSVEEKLDGANLGFSLGDDRHLRIQNRRQYLTAPYVGQFIRLPPWLPLHAEAIVAALGGGNLILFGEWCAAKHSLDYDRLPDWFVAFDVYDRGWNRFWSSTRRNVLARQLGLSHVLPLASGRLTLAQIRDILMGQPSRYRHGPMEGLVIRRETAQWCETRAKLVRADFTQAINGHWRRRPIEWNRIGQSISET